MNVPDLDELLRVTRACADDLSVETYLVGGFVRDRLLGHPSKDIDLLVVGDNGITLLAAIARHFGWPRPQQFERFGTGQIRGDDFILEVVQARSERYDPTSRKPDVRPGTLDEDIWRRDFTVNALCQTLEGEVLDRTGHGMDDLKAKVLRTPLDPHETFSEDPLRMFRAARFVAQLGFRLADGVLEAIRAEAHRTSILSVERITVELQRLLTSPHPRDGMDVLRDSGLCDIVLPEISAMVGVEQGGYHEDDVYTHTMRALDSAPPDRITRLAVLMHDVGKPRTHVIAPDGKHTFYDHPSVGARMSSEILGRLRFSHDDIKDVATLVRLHLRPIQYDNETFGDAAVRRLIRDAGPLRTQLLDVARADTRASSFPNTQNIDDLSERMDRLDTEHAVSNLVAPVSGDDLMRWANRKAGPWIRAIKKALEDAILDGDIPAQDPDAAWQWLNDRRSKLLG